MECTSIASGRNDRSLLKRVREAEGGEIVPSEADVRMDKELSCQTKAIEDTFKKSFLCLIKTWAECDMGGLKKYLLSQFLHSLLSEADRVKVLCANDFTNVWKICKEIFKWYDGHLFFLPLIMKEFDYIGNDCPKVYSLVNIQVECMGRMLVAYMKNSERMIQWRDRDCSQMVSIKIDSEYDKIPDFHSERVESTVRKVLENEKQIPAIKIEFSTIESAQKRFPRPLTSRNGSNADCRAGLPSSMQHFLTPYPHQDEDEGGYRSFLSKVREEKGGGNYSLPSKAVVRKIKELSFQTKAIALTFTIIYQHLIKKWVECDMAGLKEYLTSQPLHSALSKADRMKVCCANDFDDIWKICEEKFKWYDGHLFFLPSIIKEFNYVQNSCSEAHALIGIEVERMGKMLVAYMKNSKRMIHCEDDDGSPMVIICLDMEYEKIPDFHAERVESTFRKGLMLLNENKYSDLKIEFFTVESAQEKFPQPMEIMNRSSEADLLAGLPPPIQPFTAQFEMNS